MLEDIKIEEPCLKLLREELKAILEMTENQVESNELYAVKIKTLTEKIGCAEKLNIQLNKQLEDKIEQTRK